MIARSILETLKTPTFDMSVPIGLSACLMAVHAAFGHVAFYGFAALAPVALMAARAAAQTRPSPGKSGRTAAMNHLNTLLRGPADNGNGPACLLVAVDGFQDLSGKIGHAGRQDVQRRVLERISDTVRGQDTTHEIEPGIYCAVLAPSGRMDLESLLSVSARLQQTLAEGIRLDATTLRLTASVGFCAANTLDKATPARILDAAESALGEAQRQGGGAIRAYSPEIRKRQAASRALAGEAERAIESGALRPWFQPQISTDTAQVTGFEALARWQHPEKGLVSPAEFLPALDAAGLLPRLGEAILYHSLTALRAWDRAGVTVPCVGVNFSDAELRDPALVDRIVWDLDRFDLEPSRLTVEVLESVIAGTPDDTIVRNIRRLAELGCPIDLDDFGTGHASITSIRRFDVSRIKIDRSFVSGVDRDPEQQKMAAAILSLAERLDLDTLAEGVETGGEHTMLSQLGCGSVQGFAIGRPMPFEDTIAWLARHQDRIAPLPTLSRRSS